MGKNKKQVHDLEEMLLGYLRSDSGFLSDVVGPMLDVRRSSFITALS
jgi:hypothetical protein